MQAQDHVAVILEGVSHAYGTVTALKPLGFSLAAGTRLAIVGPDGVGKSTLLALIAGVKKRQTGSLHVLSADMGKSRQRRRVQPRIAYMPQGLGKNLYPNLTVAENIDFFGRLFGHGAAERARRSAMLMRATGLSPFADRLMGKLSGGMKQKLGLCCALVHDPDLLLLDEPTTGVDPLSRRQFWDLVESIQAARPGLTVITATSDMEEAERFGRVMMIDAGVILADGTPEALRKQAAATSLEAAFIALLPEEKRQGYNPSRDRLPLPPSAEIAIEAHGLTRRFGAFTAVDHVDLSIPKGEIFGFLGSNGCGKSTTMKMLTGLLPMNEGEARLFGAPVDPADIEARRRVGYMSQGFSLYGELTVMQNLTLHAAIFDLTGAAAEKRIAELTERFGLQAYLHQISEQLLLGVRQRLQLAVALIHAPDILILDEPTSGVDPIARDGFWNDLIALSRQSGVTIFISTHFMAEAERCDRIAFMHAGKVIATGAPEALKAQTGAASLDDAFIAFMRRGGRDVEEKPETSDFSSETAASSRMPQGRAFSLGRLLAYSRREAMELVRDNIRLGFALIGTALLMLIFSYGLTLDVDHLKFAVLDRDQSAESRAYIDAYAASPAFTLTGRIASEAGVVNALRGNRVMMVLDIPEKFGADLRAGRTPAVLAMMDGAMPFRAETALGYISGAHQRYLEELARLSGGTVRAAASVEMRYRYNQAFLSIEAMVPAVIALLLVFIPSILTALGVVSEKEMGSISNLYVTPVTKLEFLLGKQVPYVAIGLINYLILVLMAVFLFGVPLKGSFLGLTLAAFVYVLSTTAIGIFSSTFTSTQVAALFVTAIGVMMPATQFSGLLQPVSTLDGAGKLIGTVFPATYFMRASVGGFTKGLGFADLAGFLWPLLLCWLVLLAAGWLFLRKQER
ncbi:ribosome-associated ATPase/putative transporter RbbA [Rhizobium paknamense]|uniref:Ribosome-dependent ATPase n=1 Tax=Rhizobium paknamense TaxID=1206817 RepID=A0ABU0ID37_9HYPH|nr:ribosome-associated ATPase/putative transporter RbbA [Rhizobium paknamense]MDQ0456166.1 ribosome-dependent ATPase [Rhizobium paknamense]